MSSKRRSKRKEFDCYGPALEQFRREHGRAKTYLLFLVCSILACALLYGAYWLSMKA